MRHELVIGVDSGGTTTRAVVADLRGCVLGVGEAGAGNLRDVGPRGLAAAVSEAVDAAFAGAGLERGPALAAFVGVAGCSTEAERRAGLEGLEGLGLVELGPRGAVGIGHDLRTAHAGAFLGGPGVVLIVGTGACCYGRDGDGGEYRAGGWGGRLDDGGGAAWLGQRALAAVFRAMDGRGPRTVLTEAVLEGLGVGDAREALVLLEGAGYRERFGAVAPLVTAAAAEGDGVALEIVERGAGELAGMVEAVTRGMAAGGASGGGAGAVGLAMVGGVIGAGGVMRGAVERAVRERMPGCRVVEAAARPEVGAAFLALGMLGSVGAGAREELRRSGRA